MFLQLIKLNKSRTNIRIPPENARKKNQRRNENYLLKQSIITFLINIAAKLTRLIGIFLA